MSEGDQVMGRTLGSMEQEFGVSPKGSGDFSIGSRLWPGISKLVEECGETLQVAGKLMATAGRTDHWDGTDLRQRLIEELGDLSAAVKFVAETNGLLDEVKTRKIAKLNAFRRWHHGV